MSEMSETPELWERLPGESEAAFKAFEVFLALGPGRTVAATAKALKKPRPGVQGMATTRRWVERAAAWDERAAQLARERDEAERAAARDAAVALQRQIGGAFMRLVSLRVLEHVDGKPNTERMLKPEDLTPGEVARLARVGSDLLRGAHFGAVESGFLSAVTLVDKFVALALEFVEPHQHEAFLTAVDERLGIGSR